MHPDFAWEIIRQRTRELREEARKDLDARTAREAGRQRRNRAAAAASVPVPRVPDYVDGTFHESGDPAHAS